MLEIRNTILEEFTTYTLQHGHSRGKNEQTLTGQQKVSKLKHKRGEKSRAPEIFETITNNPAYVQLEFQKDGRVRKGQEKYL